MGKTRDLYLSYVKTLRKKFLAMSPEAHSRDALPIGLVDYLIAYAPSIRPKTFINYRCGLLYWINPLPESAETRHARLVLQVSVRKSGFKGPRPGKTSSLYSSSSCRPRTFRRRQFDALIAELNRRSAQGAGRRNGKRVSEFMVWLLRAWPVACAQWNGRALNGWTKTGGSCQSRRRRGRPA